MSSSEYLLIKREATIVCLISSSPPFPLKHLAAESRFLVLSWSFLLYKTMLMLCKKNHVPSNTLAYRNAMYIVYNSSSPEKKYTTPHS